MGRLVNVYYMDKEALLTNNADVDEEAIVFGTSPSYDELVAKVRHVLEWMGPNDGVELIGRIVIDASKAYSQPPTSQENEVEFYAPNACSQPPTSQANEVDVIASEKIIQEDGDDADGDEDELEEGFHDDEGPEEELNQDGLTKEENQIHFELTGLKIRTHLFQDLSRAHKDVVDGGMRNKTIEPTPCPDPREPRDENEDKNAYMKKGVKFLTLAHMKIWFSDYAIRNQRPYYVEHSDINLRYKMKCMGRTCVYVHHVDKDAFLKGNIDPDLDELDMVFDLCPSYAELLEQVRKDLNWMDPSDVVEFAGRHNVGFGMHIRWKTMRVNSEQRWLAYKDTVAESLDKALELFAMKTNVPNLLDLNRVSSSIVEAIPATINEEASIEPLSCVYEANEEVNIEHEPLVQANYEHYDDGNVLHDNNLGDLDKYNLQETMDHSIPYSRGYASECDDEGPDEEVDEEGFTAKEAEAFTKAKVASSRMLAFVHGSSQ
ncbi:hypothetical protein D1007_60707 [Hordeum vulgare]|nr:hypothetical protein D1007_60707 [Hordeum vulgare]